MIAADTRPCVQVFPQRPGEPFPATFEDIVKTIFKRLFRIYAHMYWSHLDKIQELGAEKHLNTCFKHFCYFTAEFNLIDQKELAPLQACCKVARAPANAGRPALLCMFAWAWARQASAPLQEVIDGFLK